MELTGNIRVAEDQDFTKLWELVEAEDIWTTNMKIFKSGASVLTVITSKWLR